MDNDIESKGTTFGTRKAPSCTMVIFGASGDLTKRLLIPALYNLAKANRLPDNFALIGVGRTEQSADAFRRNLEEGVKTFVSDTASQGTAQPFDAELWE